MSTALCVDGDEVVSECGAADACPHGQCSPLPNVHVITARGEVWATGRAADDRGTARNQRVEPAS
jgi:hypothetical protein